MRWAGSGDAWWIILLFGGVALCCLLVTPVKKWRFERFAERAVWATARVVGIHTERSNTYGNPDASSVTTYHADLQFKTEEGVLVEVRREVTEDVEEGAEIPVAYHVEDPYEARLDWTSNPWAGSAWVGVFGFVVFAAIGIWMLWGIGAIEFS